MTGAGSGIGRATAFALAERGADLVLCDIDPEGLESSAAGIRALGRNILSHRVDVSDRTAMRNFAVEVHAEIEAVDILINNAGVALIGDFRATSLEDWDWILGINLMGVIHGLHYFLPPMLTRGAGGHIVNISSVAGFLAPSLLCAYSTTKFGVFALSEALRAELKPHGIGVTAVCPGVIDTAIAERARFRSTLEDPAARQEFLGRSTRVSVPPELVASKILKAIARNRAVAPVTAGAWLSYYLKRLAPGPLLYAVDRISRRSLPDLAP